jgi:ABC-type glycerol-3-phosphate transport system permease component
VDGAGPWRTFFSVIVPMSKPVFAPVTILTFLTQWGSFLWPALMVSDPSVRRLPLEISMFSAQHPPPGSRRYHPRTGRPLATRLSKDNAGWPESA